MELNYLISGKENSDGTQKKIILDMTHSLEDCSIGWVLHLKNETRNIKKYDIQIRDDQILAKDTDEEFWKRLIRRQQKKAIKLNNQDGKLNTPKGVPCLWVCV